MIFDVYEFGVKLSVMVLDGDGKDQNVVTWVQGMISSEDLCEKRGENKNSEGWKWNITGVTLRLNW